MPIFRVLRERRVLLVGWQGCRARAHCVWTVLFLLSRFKTYPLLELVAIVGEGAVRLGHAVRVFAALDGGALPVRGIENLIGELLGHRSAGTAASGGQNPANRQTLATASLDLDRHLIGRAADSARLDLEERSRVGDSLLEDLERATARSLFDDVRARRT